MRMTTAHDFPDISLSSIGTNGSSPGRHGRLSTFDDDEFVTASSHVAADEVVPNSTVASTHDSIVPDSRRSVPYRESVELFDDSDMDVSRALPPRRTRRAAVSPVQEEIDNNENEAAPDTPELRTMRVTQYAEDEGGDVIAEESPARIYPRLSMLKESNFRHLDFTHLSQRKGSYRSMLHSPQSERSPAPSSQEVSEGRPCGCGSQAHDKSSDQVYGNLERRFAEALNVSGSQYLRGDEGEREHCMDGVVALIETRCCEEATSLVRKKLRMMGATINRTPSSAVTHIVWSTGGDASVLRAALDACSGGRRPHVLPPAWVVESYSAGFRQPESAFSLCDERYVAGVERRRSSAAHEQAAPAANRTSSTIDISMSIAGSDANRTEFSELTFDATMSVTQLLQKIDVMAKRLDKVECAPVRHAVRCASRAAAAEASPPAARRARPPFAPLDLPRPLRRRSHDAFTLAHRAEPYDRQQAAVRLASRDVLEALPRIAASRGVAAAAAAAGTVDGVDDMRRTVETDLNRIRQTLRNNANYTRHHGVSMRGRGGRGKAGRPSLSFLLPTSPRSPPQSKRRGRPSVAVVRTQSKMINQLQAVNSSEEFQKAPRGKKTAATRKRVAMLTGFGGREERYLLALADAVQLRITKEMDDSLRAVVSVDGARTVSTLRAVVRGVPVVTEEWLRSCKRANRLVHTLPYEWPQWKELITKRESARRGVFAALGGKIKVCDLCSPSTPVLKELIMRSGGWLTSEAASAVLIVAPTGVRRPQGRGEGAAVVVEEKYILNCITENKLIPLPGMTESIDDSLLSEE